MINIFFVPGMFGTTIEFCIRNFTVEYSTNFTDLENYIMPDGSLHSYTKWDKEYHPSTVERYKETFSKKLHNCAITTPIYPLHNFSFPEIIQSLTENYNIVNGKNILIHAKDLNEAELNLFFHYEKLIIGQNHGLKDFLNPINNQQKASSWSKNYSSWEEMDPWERREWFSIFYPSMIASWVDSQHCVNNSFLKISNGNFLNDTKECIQNIFNHCNLTKNQKDIDKFVTVWQNKQEYIVNSKLLCDTIVKNTLSQTHYTWKSLNFLQEAVIQKKLRDAGYELRCWKLNEFPNNTKELYNLIEKV